MDSYLNPKIIEDMREAVSSSFLLKKNNAKFNLICAVMDRVDSASRYLNEHLNYPNDESAYLMFMNYVCMIQDALFKIKPQLDGLEFNYTCDKNEFFGEVFDMSPLNKNPTNRPNDLEFFRYLRSISFAHPFETSRAGFIPKGIEHYSPMVTLNPYGRPLNGYNECISIMIYPNKGNDFVLYVPWKSLLGFVQLQYELFSQCTIWIKERLEEQIAEWKKQKVDRSGTVPEILRRIIDLISARYDTFSNSLVDENNHSLVENDYQNSKTWSVYELFRDYTIKISDVSNEPSVERYRMAISESIPKLCDIIDNVGDWDEVTFRFLFSHPKTMHSGCGYELEKIHAMSEKNYSSIYIGRNSADDFSKGFACKWVHIDAHKMPVEEIQLLANVACYLESQDVGSMDL